MGLKYTEEKLNSLDKETIIQLFLSQQEQLEGINQNLQLVLEQMADLKRHRFGRSMERHETEGQISFMEVDGTVVFFNEAEAVVAEAGDAEDISTRKKPRKRNGKREEDLKGLPVVVIEHALEETELNQCFGENGWKELPDEVYRRYAFTPRKSRSGRTSCKGIRGKENRPDHKSAPSEKSAA